MTYAEAYKFLGPRLLIKAAAAPYGLYLPASPNPQPYLLIDTSDRGTLHLSPLGWHAAREDQ